MSAYQATGVHYRVSGSAGSCHAVFVTAAVGDSITGQQMDNGLLGALVTAPRAGIARDTVDPEFGHASGTAGTWHYPNECPDA